ncbi:MAG: DUF4960 domain-containing protein [[Clostridium] fimetarium]|nr:DUF4960 domain-containing protein [Alistipes timonensis]MCM1404957.1 DUF4960 domain-containing protein [[Clostridium] fimetarium]
MNKFLLSATAALTIASAASVSANNRIAILTDNLEASALDFQESAAVDMLRELHNDAAVIKASDAANITKDNYDCVWIHIDRIGIGAGWDKLPEAFRADATINALKKFLADGGNIYLSKQATQLITPLGRTDAKFAPNIFSDGDGGKGTDVWTVNAQIGYINVENDPSQYYDRRGHAIYAGVAVNNDYACETFGLLGSGNGTEMHREDHNCMWDFNAYQYTVEGKNTVEKFEKENNALVLGAWGHVVDYACAGIIEFLPQAASREESAKESGRILANGLAAYELSPREGVKANSCADNIKKLTANTLNYLAPKQTTTAIDSVADENADAPAEYFTLQGVRVSADALTPGLYIKRQGNKATKVVVK